MNAQIDTRPSAGKPLVKKRGKTWWVKYPDTHSNSVGFTHWANAVAYAVGEANFMGMRSTK